MLECGLEIRLAFHFVYLFILVLFFLFGDLGSFTSEQVRNAATKVGADKCHHHAGFSLN